jgi:nucleotide-binding universal stress UspA family protein
MPGIIVGLDGSRHSRRALEWAVNEAAVRHIPLGVLTVHPAAVGYFGDVETSDRDTDLTGRAQAAAEAVAGQVLAGLTGPRPESVKVRAVNGFPVEVLVNASKDADMLVLGSHGAGRFTHILMGSTAEQVTRHAHCPVLVVPAATEADHGYAALVGERTGPHRAAR